MCYDTKVCISQRYICADKRSCTHTSSLFLIQACSSGLIMRFYLTVNSNLYSETLIWFVAAVDAAHTQNHTQDEEDLNSFIASSFSIHHMSAHIFMLKTYALNAVK